VVTRTGDSGEGRKFAGTGDEAAGPEMMQGGETEAIKGKRRSEHG
jgi:hypothetical protein